MQINPQIILDRFDGYTQIVIDFDTKKGAESLPQVKKSMKSALLVSQAFLSMNLYRRKSSLSVMSLALLSTNSPGRTN